MALRGNSFVKIFLGFWLLTVTILGSWLVADHYFESRPGSEQAAHKPPAGPPHRFILRLIYNLQNVADDELPQLVRKANAEHGVDIFLLDRLGRDILEREVPEQVLQVAQQLHGSRRRAFHNTPRERLLAYDIYRREQGPLRVVLAFPEPKHKLLGVLGGNLWLRLGLAVLISGLVCFGLSRLMTNRLKAVQQAARRLANGELDTRLQVRQTGGDETDELARDFNSMAEQLQERIQAQKRLLGDVSHELRSPLARLRVALALAQEGSAKSGDYLLRIEHETERLEELIGQLLSSRMGELQLDLHLDLLPLLQQLCADANFEGETRGRQVLFKSAVGEAIIASSGDLLHKSFDNILRNALSHTPDNSQVTVSLEQEDDTYRIHIEDRGPGVPEEELGRIFGEFYRVDTARTPESGGYGLGLAIARRAILQHGGQVRAENTGSGLAVTVVLPAGH